MKNPFVAALLLCLAIVGLFALCLGSCSSLEGKAPPSKPPERPVAKKQLARTPEPSPSAEEDEGIEESESPPESESSSDAPSFEDPWKFKSGLTAPPRKDGPPEYCISCRATHPTLLELPDGSTYDGQPPEPGAYSLRHGQPKWLRPQHEDVDAHALEATPKDEISVPQLAAYLSLRCRNDRDKARAIYRWIGDRLVYDFEYRAYYRPCEALKLRRVVCGGYANLYKALARDMDLECAIVTGHAQSAGDPEGGPHAWNAVRTDRIKGAWKLVDVTWGWGSGSIKHRVYTQRFDEMYFLAFPEAMAKTHFPDDPKWQLGSQLYEPR